MQLHGFGNVNSPFCSFCVQRIEIILHLNNWLAVQNLRIALKKAVFALGLKKTFCHNFLRALRKVVVPVTLFE